MTEQTGLFDCRKVKALAVDVKFMVPHSVDGACLFICSLKEKEIYNFLRHFLRKHYRPTGYCEYNILYSCVMFTV